MPPPALSERTHCVSPALGLFVPYMKKNFQSENPVIDKKLVDLMADLEKLKEVKCYNSKRFD